MFKNLNTLAILEGIYFLYTYKRENYMAEFNPEHNTPMRKNTASDAFEQLDNAGGVDAVENALKDAYTPTLKRIGNDAGNWGKNLYNKIFNKDKKFDVSSENVKPNSENTLQKPPVPSIGIPNAKESLLLSDSTDPKYTVSTPIPKSVQPETDTQWGKIKANVSGTTLKTSIDKGSNRYSVFGDPMSQKVGASWQNGADKVQLSHNLSSGKNELGYSTSNYTTNFNASVWQKGKNVGANASYNQRINYKTQIGANAAISKTSEEGVKAAASVLYTKKGPKQNIALGAMASYEKGQSFMGVTGRITF